ncbi:MAG TPA: nitrile hydratase accessory protein, partial [Acetobacteraceae bacterium]|nr:nitrile hydratase accessory protein [Acetobacteraceae bacterium]
FREPWQAKAFALVVLLHREGHFGWEEWVRTLAGEIAESPQRADEDAELAYHRQFLAALEKIVATHGMTTPEAMQARKLAWRRAYLNTPHGHPVDLSAAEGGDPDGEHDGHAHLHDHDLVPQRAPVTVSPGRNLRY